MDSVGALENGNKKKAPSRWLQSRILWDGVVRTVALWAALLLYAVLGLGFHKVWARPELVLWNLVFAAGVVFVLGSRLGRLQRSPKTAGRTVIPLAVLLSGLGVMGGVVFWWTKDWYWLIGSFAGLSATTVPLAQRVRRAGLLVAVNAALTVVGFVLVWLTGDRQAVWFPAVCALVTWYCWKVPSGSGEPIGIRAPGGTR